jgi:hypothetical protein
MPTALSATRDESAMRFFLDSPSLDRPEGQLDRGDLIMNNRKRYGLALSLTILAGLLAMMPRSDEGAVLVLPDTEYLVSAGELGALQAAGDLGILVGFGIDPESGRCSVELAMQPAAGASLPERAMRCASIELDELGRFVGAVPAATTAPPTCAVLLEPHPDQPGRFIVHCVGTCANGHACALYFDLGSLRWTCGCP